MKLSQLTNKLQDLCHEGYSNEEVIAESGGFGISITSIKRCLQEVKDEKGAHEEHIIVLGSEK